ncbi:MAG: hypothetical protein SPI83_08045 [Rothia sp. (in: high G+C Gram-positive bacteria)]|nr:hypothetical protein [Rothia sp. (in: high G+C Gram-positive bacteria)]
MKNTASMTLKRVSALAAIAGAMLATTGCTYTNQPATTIVYSASDGQMVNLIGENGQQDIQLRNIMVIAADETSQGRLLGTILNQTEEDATVTLAFPTETLTLKIPAGQEVRLEDDKNQLLLDKAGATPGLLLKDVEVSSTVTPGTETFNVPVLDGTLEEYAPYLPTTAASNNR